MKARFELHKQHSKAEYPDLLLCFLEALTPITHTPPDGQSLGSIIVEPPLLWWDYLQEWCYDFEDIVFITDR